MSVEGVPLTFHASQAVMIGELLKVKFANETYGDGIRRRLHIADPDGPSTDGGRKARQAITLESEDRQGGRIVAGFLDVNRRTAEIRSFVAVAQQYQARHKLPIDLPRGHYEEFITELSNFLKSQSINVTLTDAAPQQATPQLPGRPGGQPSAAMSALVGAFGLVVGVAIGLVIFTLQNY